MRSLFKYTRFVLAIYARSLTFLAIDLWDGLQHLTRSESGVLPGWEGGCIRRDNDYDGDEDDEDDKDDNNLGRQVVTVLILSLPVTGATVRNTV